MYRRSAALIGVALCAVLVGCNSSTTTTVRAAPHTVKGWPIAEANFPIVRQGWYRYTVAFARMPPRPGAQSQTCLAPFELLDGYGGPTTVMPPDTVSGTASGSVYLIAGTYTGISQVPPAVGGPYGPPNPPGTFY